MLNAHAQTCDHAHFRHLLETMIATSHTRAESVTLSQQIGEVAAISAGIFASFWAKRVELLQVVVKY